MCKSITKFNNPNKSLILKKIIEIKLNQLTIQKMSIINRATNPYSNIRKYNYFYY